MLARFHSRIGRRNERDSRIGEKGRKHELKRSPEASDADFDFAFEHLWLEEFRLRGLESNARRSQSARISHQEQRLASVQAWDARAFTTTGLDPCLGPNPVTPPCPSHFGIPGFKEIRP